MKVEGFKEWKKMVGNHRCGHEQISAAKLNCSHKAQHNLVI